MAADYSRIHRLLKILTLIQGSKGWTARRLAQECGTTERTIYRDMKMLEGAGIPYFYDEEANCYSIRRDFFIQSVQLTFDEALALVALAEHVGGQEQVPFTRPAARAIRKVRGQLPAAIQKDLDQIVGQVAVKLAAAMPPEAAADVYETIQRALAEKRVLRCEYDSTTSARNGKTQQFLLKPYTLFFNQRAWYVIGHHGRHDEVRCLKLNRFTRIEMTDLSYRIPSGFTLAQHLGNAWRMIRGSKTYEIELQFAPGFAETIADTQWHGTQEVIWNDDHSITFRCRVDGLEEIVWWVLSMGPHCTVTKPRELADRVKELAEQVVRNYSGKAGASGAPRAPANPVPAMADIP
jgi:predicted DNA-binding transcriptional regulator YafY